MKTYLLKAAAIIIAATIMASCSANGEKTAISDTETAESPKKDTLIAIQDCPQQMSAELFAGQNDKLLKQILPDGKAEASINVFLLKGENCNILFDAGLGEANNGQMLAKLDSMGITPEKISDICLTHFHGDHIGGLLNAEGKAVFPNAKLHFSDIEYEAWTEGPLKERNEQVLAMLEAYEGRYEKFSDGDTILNGIVAIIAPGHTPGHTIYDLGDAIVAGDIMHALALQADHPEFCAKYDFEPSLATETRKSVLEIARTTHKSLAGMHFPAPHIIKL